MSDGTTDQGTEAGVGNNTVRILTNMSTKHDDGSDMDLFICGCSDTYGLPPTHDLNASEASVVKLSLILIYEPTRQAENSYAVFCLIR